MGTIYEFMVRAAPPSERYPHGVAEQKLPAEYEPHELEHMRKLTRLIEVAPPGSEARAQLMNELHTIHELKALFDGHLDESEEAPPGPESAVPLGTEGREGGSVPTLSADAAERLFETWRGEEYGWLKSRVLLLALEHGEYHSEMLTGLPISTPQLVASAVRSLSQSNVPLIEPLNARGEQEHRMTSSKTSRRRSYVYRLTPEGHEVATSLKASSEMVTLAHPDRNHEQGSLL